MAKERALNGLNSWTGDRPMTVQHIFKFKFEKLDKRLYYLYYFES